MGSPTLASNPGFPFQILSRNFGEKLRDKIRNGKPGFEASPTLPLLCSQNVATDKIEVTMPTMHSWCYFSITIHGIDAVNVTYMHLQIFLT